MRALLCVVASAVVASAGATDICEPLTASSTAGDTFPLSRWLRLTEASAEPVASGYVVLAGNASAHAATLACALREVAASGSEARHLLDQSAWHELSCAGECPSLLDDVASAVEARSGRWSVVLVRAAERMPRSQLGVLATRFFHAARCLHATAQTRIDADCRRILFVLSTSWGADALAQPDVRDRPRHRLLSSALVEAAPWLSALTQVSARQRLRSAFSVVLGDAPAERFGALKRRADAERDARRLARAGAGGDGGGGGGGVAAPAHALPDLSVFERVSGQGAVVSEVRARLAGIASGADGGEDAHTFFFYGFPGTGKTLLAELIALAQHGTTAPPSYQRFSMQVQARITPEPSEPQREPPNEAPTRAPRGA